MNSSSSANGGSWRLAAACLAVVVGLVGLAPSAAAAEPSDPPFDTVFDTVSVAGYDSFTSDRDAPVIAGTDNNLVFRFVASSALRDGTVTLDLPNKDWPDPLTWWGSGLDYLSPGGSVVVRPNPSLADTPGGCRAAPMIGSVDQLPKTQRITVQHVTCEPGEQVAVRIFRIAAPRTPRVYSIPVSLNHATGGEAQILPLRVAPQSNTRLTVSLPRVVQFGEPVTVVVRALRPDGRIDRSYRGSVRLMSADQPDCLFDEGVGQRVDDFTAADAGVHRFTFTFAGRTDRIAAHDVGREARPGRSNRFEIEGFPEAIVCPISFH